MTQSSEAAERSAHVNRDSGKTDDRPHPIIEVSPGVYKLRVIAELEAKITKLEAKVGRMEAWETLYTTAIEQYDAKIAKLQDIIALYIDPFIVADEFEAVVEEAVKAHSEREAQR